MVLDAYNRVIDSNPAATGLLGLPRSQIIGRYVTALLPPLAGPVEAHRPGISRQEEISTTADHLGRPGRTAIHLAVQLSSLTDRSGHEAGRLMVLRDVTQRTETERRLRELLDAETHLATVLQTSLRPASLPTVPWVHLAARSLPAGQGTQVSGDFYDVHQELGGDWAANSLGWCYRQGRGVSQDHAEAFRLFKQSAEGGNTEAMSMTGFCYEKGQGTPTDYVQMLVWYRKAAALGNRLAINNLASQYDEGNGVEVDYAEAIRLYTINNAHLHHEEKEKGSLEAGKLADLIVIDRDILKCPVTELRDVKVEYTVLGGKVVYQRTKPK